MKKKEQKFYVYFYYIEEELVYIGRTVDPYNRYKRHKNDFGNDFNKINKIKIAKCKSKADMVLYEIYYIAKFLPKYNKVATDYGNPSIDLCDLNFKEYTIKQFEYEYRYDYDVAIPTNKNYFYELLETFKKNPYATIKIGEDIFVSLSHQIPASLFCTVIDKAIKKSYYQEYDFYFEDIGDVIQKYELWCSVRKIGNRRRPSEDYQPIIASKAWGSPNGNHGRVEFNFSYMERRLHELINLNS